MSPQPLETLHPPVPIQLGNDHSPPPAAPEIIDVDADSPPPFPNLDQHDPPEPREVPAMLKPDDPEFSLAIPRRKAPETHTPSPPRHQETGGLLPTPEGSDFDESAEEEELAMKAARQPCPNVKHSLSMLPLQNIGICIPKFLRYEAPTPNELMVVRAFEDLLEAEKARRAQDPYAVAKPPRSIFIVAMNARHAMYWEELLKKQSCLTVATHGIESNGSRRRYSHRDSRALDSVFELKDVVITLPYTAHDDAECGFLYLRRVALLVFDIDFDSNRHSEPCISDLRHPLNLLMRDFYRALPVTHRPRVLTIYCGTLRPRQFPPIEHNLFCKFLSTDVRPGAEWKSCYGRSARSIETCMMDVEDLFYSVKSVGEESEIQARSSRKRPLVNETRIRSRLSELEFLSEEVGPLGVALYQRRWKHRYAEKRAGLARSRESINSRHPLSCDMPLVGLSEKVLHLLNELQRAYAASTQYAQLRVIVHAGRPTVACALAEIISAIPVFQGLQVRTALGSEDAKSFESYAADDDGRKTAWQGEETDDEAVSNFAGGDAQILIVARAFCTRSQNYRPIPPCAFVLRFDESVADPSMDGGGGRCRVVQFRERERKGRVSTGMRSSGRQPRELKPESDKVASDRASDPHPTVFEKDQPRQGTEVATTQEKALTNTDDANKEGTEKEKGGADPSRVEQASESQTLSGPDVDRDQNAHIYYCRPPAALLGPDEETLTCFLYRAFVFEAIPGLVSPPANAMPRKIGIEDFVLVLSEQLDDGNRTVLLPDTTAHAGSNNGIAAYMKLDYQGKICLSDDQLHQARQYTAAIFSLASPVFRTKGFHWEGFRSTNLKISQSPQDNEGSDSSFLRRYLVLPVAASENFRPEECPASGVPELANSDKRSVLTRLVKTYFGSECHPQNLKWPEFSCSVDWESVRNLLQATSNASNCETTPVECNAKGTELYSGLEGKLIISSFPGEPVMLSGRLQYNLCPLSKHMRSQKFSLNDDGTLAHQEGLASLTNVEASEQTVALQGSISSLDRDSDGKTKSVTAPIPVASDNPEQVQPTSKEILDPVNRKVGPVKWSESEKRLVFDNKVISRKRKHSEMSLMLFDAGRNVMKKRKTWVGKVYYSYETYYRKHNPSRVKLLDQPLIVASQPVVSGYNHFIAAVREKPVADVCDEIVKNGISKQMLIPELCRLYPVPTGVVFLPSALFHLEKHLSLCELRKKFDSKVGIVGDLDYLRQCVTAEHVNRSRNYERLEFLGDSVLKLSCTKRLFTRHPHDSEGKMHNMRAFRVSNERLHRLGQRLGLHHYLQFRADSVDDWRPPGTDVKGRAQKVTVKGLADVVEALCGAYFLFGVKGTAADETNGNSKQKQALGTSLLVSYANSDSSSDSFSESIEMDENEDRIISLHSTGRQNNMRERESKTDPWNSYGKNIRPLTAVEIEAGYIAGYKFLQECQVFEDEEPTPTELLRSAIHAMHPPGSKAPRDVLPELFPPDRRLTNPKVPWEQQFGPLEKKLRYEFKRRPLLICALTHGSYVKENGKSMVEQQTFQRLEYFGDAVLDFFVVVYLYHRYPELGPGELTTLKGNVVSNESFARLSVQMGLHDFLFHGSTSITAEIADFVRAVEGEREDGHGEFGALKRTMGEIAAPKVLGDIFESVIGAIYVDSGLQDACRVSMQLLGKSLKINADPRRDDTHPTAELRDLVMRAWKLSWTPPRYDQEAFGSGRRGKKCMSVYILGEKIASGFGTTAKRAKLKAAVAALALLKDEDPNSAGAEVLRRLREESIKRKLEQQRTYQ